MYPKITDPKFQEKLAKHYSKYKISKKNAHLMKYAFLKNTRYNNHKNF